MQRKWLTEFQEYLNSRGMKESTTKNYMRYIRHYLKISDSVGSHIDARHLFEVSNIERYYNDKSGSNASAVLSAFAEYLLEKKEINRHELLLIKDRILDLKKPQETFNEIDILSKKDIEMVLSDRIHYRFLDNPDRLDREISIVGPVICALALSGFEQQELMNLSISDLDVSHNRYRVRNLYKGDDELLTEWITLDDAANLKLIKYLEYRATLDADTDKLLLMKRKPLDNGLLNSTFSIFKRADNCSLFSNGGEISAQLLIRSKLTHAMFQTNGTCLIDMIRIFGLSNAQVSYAVRKYLEKTKLS